MIVILPLKHIHLHITEVETSVTIEIVIPILIIAAAPHPSPIHLCPILVLLPQITTIPTMLLVNIEITRQPRDTMREETTTKSLSQSPTQPSTYPTALTGKAIFFPRGTLLWRKLRIW